MISEAARAARNAYARRWRQMHPEAAREIQRRYWERRAEREAALRDLEKRCRPCSCGCRPEIILESGKYLVICNNCGRALSPVTEPEEVVRLWNLARTEKRMEYAVPSMNYETR